MERIGRYRIIGELGQGAMGVVYHATDPSIGRSVAIKTIRIRDINDTQQRDKLRERLFREARSAGVLSHPNIVTIYDMDEADGLAYIAMAYVNGPTLEKILASETPLSGSNMLRILRQTASGLDYAHGRGIVHRDVKPANVMTDEDGAVKITDFGIAKITAVNNMTETRTVVGTPNYMSPEQVQGMVVDGRSDQFSLAVIAYEILTGERPFPGEHLSTVVYKIVAEQPPEAHRLNATLTPQIDAVLRRALAKQPDDRYPNCSNFVGALEMACAESRGWTTLTAGGAAAMPTVAVERPAIRVPQEPVRRKIAPLPELAESTESPLHAPRSPSILAPFLMSVFVVLGIAGVITWQAGGIPGVVSFGPHQEVAQEVTKGVPQEVRQKEAPRNPAPPPDADVKQTPAEPAALSQPAPETAAPEPEVRKPSPLKVPSGAAREDGPQEIARLPSSQVPASRLQDVWVATNPPGAKVVLDDNLAQPCQTPCMVHGTAGVHHLTISQAGYLNEYREIHIGDTAQDIPLIALRKPSGTLMLTTSPPGATIHVNGQLWQQLTPAQITLPPGSYSVTVEKGGRSQTQRIELQQNTTYVRIPLDQ